MLAKLLALLSTAKGAAAAGIVAAAAVGTGVTATNQDVQNALNTAIRNVTEKVESERPAVVAARNDADKKLRDAFKNDQRMLEKLRDTKVEGSGGEQVRDLIKRADDKLKDRLEKALDDVAALTKGREGHETDTQKSSTEVKTSPEVKSSAEVKSSPEAKESQEAKVVFNAEMQTKVNLIVTTAIAEMDKIANDAVLAVAAFPVSTTGKAGETRKPGETAKPAETNKADDSGRSSPRP